MSSHPATATAIDRNGTPPSEWESHLRDHADALRRWARGRLGGEEGLDDILQEVAIASVRGDKRPSDPAKILPWLKAVARHKIADHQRARGREQRLRVAVAAEDVTDAAHGRDWVLGVDRLETVREALGSLPPDERALLVDKYAEGESCRILAARRGLTVKALDHRLAKARDRLRALVLRNLSAPE